MQNAMTHFNALMRARREAPFAALRTRINHAQVFAILWGVVTRAMLRDAHLRQGGLVCLHRWRQMPMWAKGTVP